MSEPTPSRFRMEILRADLSLLWSTIDYPINLEDAAYNRLRAALDELAALRARVAEQERAATSDPDVNAAREAVRSLTVFTPQIGRDMTPVNLSEAGDRIAVVIEAYVDQIRWRVRTEPLLRTLTDAGAILRLWDDKVLWCIHCNANVPYGPLTHKPDCPVVAARALLGEGGQ